MAGPLDLEDRSRLKNWLLGLEAATLLLSLVLMILWAVNYTAQNKSDILLGLILLEVLQLLLSGADVIMIILGMPEFLLKKKAEYSKTVIPFLLQLALFGIWLGFFTAYMVERQAGQLGLFKFDPYQNDTQGEWIILLAGALKALTVTGVLAVYYWA